METTGMFSLEDFSTMSSLLLRKYILPKDQILEKERSNFMERTLRVSLLQNLLVE